MRHHAPRKFLALLLGVVALPAAAADLTVSAAASLTDAFKAIATAYEAEHPGTKVLLNFAASGVLLQQIDNGAPVDVFATADAETMDQAESRGLLAPGSRADFARNALVLVVPAGAEGPRSLAELGSPAVKRVAISNPETVPVGRYTRDALAAAGQWAAVEPRMISTQNVRQSLDYVIRGEVDAGFVYATDARIAGDKLRVVATVPTTRPIIYPIAVVKATRQVATAADFASFVRSPAARSILATFGFQE